MLLLLLCLLQMFWWISSSCVSLFLFTVCLIADKLHTAQYTNVTTELLLLVFFSHKRDVTLIKKYFKIIVWTCFASRLMNCLFSGSPVCSHSAGKQELNQVCFFSCWKSTSTFICYSGIKQFVQKFVLSRTFPCTSPAHGACAGNIKGNFIDSALEVEPCSFLCKLLSGTQSWKSLTSNI